MRCSFCVSDGWKQWRVQIKNPREGWDSQGQLKDLIHSAKDVPLKRELLWVGSRTSEYSIRTIPLHFSVCVDHQIPITCWCGTKGLLN